MENENRELNINFMPLGKTLKPLLAILISLLLIAVVIFMIFAAMNELKKSRYIGQDATLKNSIVISGEGKIQAKPDIGQISLSVVSEAKTVNNAQKDNTEKMNKITTAMKDLGIEEKYLKTINYSIYPKYEYRRGKSEIIGYEVNQTLEAKIKDLEKVSVVLNKATELGANQIGSLIFTFENPEDLQAQARKKAIENAKEKAGILTKDLGVKLVRVLNFSESSSPMPYPMYGYAEALGVGGMGGGGEAPKVEAGQNEIIANVIITYEIQ